VQQVAGDDGEVRLQLIDDAISGGQRRRLEVGLALIAPALIAVAKMVVADVNSVVKMCCFKSLLLANRTPPIVSIPLK